MGKNAKGKAKGKRLDNFVKTLEGLGVQDMVVRIETELKQAREERRYGYSVKLQAILDWVKSFRRPARVGKKTLGALYALSNDLLRRGMLPAGAMIAASEVTTK